jgi:hypothetical protein
VSPTAGKFAARAYTHRMKSELLMVVDCDPWPTAPAENDPTYFRAWQRVSVALQRGMRRWVPEYYFRDSTRLEDRVEAHTMVAYSACRVFYGKSKTDFTWDAADSSAVQGVMRSIGTPTQRVLAGIEKRLREEGRAALSRRYLPVWYQDILREVQKRPKALMDLIAREARVIDAVIDLGTRRDEAAARRLSRSANAALRNMHGMEMTDLIPRVLNEVTISLSPDRVGRREDLVDGGVFEDDDVVTSGFPDFRIGREEDGDHRSSDSGGEMGDAGIIADVHARG